MTTETIHDDCAAFALGALDPDAAERFQAHLAAGCARCEQELAGFRRASGLLAGALPTRVPAPRMRVRVLSEAGVDRDYAVRAGDGAWEPVADGVTLKRLFIDPRDRRETRLVTLEAGATDAGDALPEGTAFLVLSGALAFGDESLEPGDWLRPAGGARLAGVRANATLFAPAVGAFAGVAKSRHSRANRARWGEIQPGTQGRLLDSDEAAGLRAMVLRMDAGATLEEHEHGGPEESFLLEGACVTQGRALSAGDYFRAPGGSHHGLTTTAGGCTMVVVEHAAR